MRKTSFIVLSALFLFLNATDGFGQRSFIRGKIKDKIMSDQEEKHRERGREELKKVSYDNDTRFPDPENRIQATFEMEMTTYKKNGTAETPIKSKIIFGKTGECMVVNAGTPEESRILFDYDKKANFMVNPKDKTATKMPLINMKKMVERMAKNQDISDENNGTWKATNETKTINGYPCRKYEFTDKDGTKMDTWVTKDVSIDISENYLFGSRIKDYGTGEAAQLDENLPHGMMIQTVIYDKKTGKPSSKTEVTSFKKSADNGYFDLSNYKVTDVLDKL